MLVIWGSSWGWGFRFHWLDRTDARAHTPRAHGRRHARRGARAHTRTRTRSHTHGWTHAETPTDTCRHTCRDTPADAHAEIHAYTYSQMCHLRECATSRLRSSEGRSLGATLMAYYRVAALCSWAVILRGIVLLHVVRSCRVVLDRPIIVVYSTQVKRFPPPTTK